MSQKGIKSDLAEASFFNAGKINDASHLVVFSVIDNLDAFESQIEENLPEGAVGYYKQVVKPLPDAQIKSWLTHQVYLSLGMFLSAAATMGIDSKPMEGIEPDKYKTILGLENYKPIFAVALGYRDEADGNQPSKTPKSRLDQKMIFQTIK
jgi:nitroreductase/dihydropteridine reductase